MGLLWQSFHYSYCISLLFITVYKEMGEAMKRHPDADVMVNFASLRSAYDSTVEALGYPQVR